MRLGNKILLIIFLLAILNLLREYIFVRPTNCENLSVDTDPIDFNILRKNWSYYSSVFNKDFKPIKPERVSLPLALCGTVVSSPKTSFAVVKDLSTGKEDLYRLGDIVSGVKIVALNRNKAVLDYNGTKEELTVGMPDTKVMADTRRQPLSQPLKLNEGMDFTRLMTQLRIKPYFENGRCIGFQIGNISGSIKQMGLRDGDIVESINGEKINDPLKALQILYNIEKNNPIHLGVERNDEKIELNCKVEG